MPTIKNLTAIGIRAIDAKLICDPNGGWEEIDEIPVYSSAVLIDVDTTTLPNTRYEEGMKCRCKQGAGYLYFYIVAVGASQLGILGDAITSAAITDFAISNDAVALDFPELFDWTPTFTGFTAAPTGGIYQFRIDGKICTVFCRQPNTGTSSTAALTISAPVAAKTLTNAVWGSACPVVDAGAAVATFGRIQIVSAATAFDAYTNAAAAGWTAGGVNKRVVSFSVSYPYV